VYDLYLKKQKTIEADIIEEFSLDIAENENSPTQVNIEDVEDLKTPNSFLKENFQTNNNLLEEGRPDLDGLRSRFEAEEDLDEGHNENHIVRTTEQRVSELTSIKVQKNEAVVGTRDQVQEQPSILSEHQPQAITDHKEEIGSRKNDWKEMLKLSETTVQMVANYDGQKVYSIL